MQIPSFVDSNRIVSNLPHPVRTRVEAWVDNLNVLLSVHNPRVLGRMAPAAVRGLLLSGPAADLASRPPPDLPRFWLSRRAPGAQGPVREGQTSSMER